MAGDRAAENRDAAGGNGAAVADIAGNVVNMDPAVLFNGAYGVPAGDDDASLLAHIERSAGPYLAPEFAAPESP